MNISVLIGLVVAFGGLLLGYSMDGGSVLSLLKPSSFIIIFGGTWGAVIASYGIGDLVGALKAFFQSLSKKNRPDPEGLIEKLCQMSDLCRQQGLLKLQELLNDNELSQPRYLLLKEGMLLALDMKTADQIQEALEADMKSYSLKKQMEIEVFSGAGGFSPTIGVIGTVMGLVMVLAKMDPNDSAALTENIASAFVATLYGVGFANLIYLPMGNYMKADLKRQKIFREMMIDGICMIASGESSRNIKNKLSLYYHAFPGGEKKYEDGINN